MLARVADTIADSKHGETDVLLNALENYKQSTHNRELEIPDFTEIANIQENENEAELLRNVSDVIEALSAYDDGDQELMLECLDIIISGQTLDLQRFGIAKEGGEISSLSNDEELDDYAYRVAGCVGVFWTKMSIKHIISINEEKKSEFLENGIRFGKALQMINILRDIPEDLRFGRCYIPKDSLKKHNLSPEDLLKHENIDSFRPLYDSYLDLTSEHLDAAIEYIKMIPASQFRLKASTMLPVLIGQRTVTLLRTGNVLNSEERIKVVRKEIKSYARKLLRALIIPGGVKRLLEKNKNA